MERKLSAEGELLVDFSGARTRTRTREHFTFLFLLFNRTLDQYSEFGALWLASTRCCAAAHASC